MQTQRNPNAVTLYVFEDLTPFTAYEVRVSAVYISGGSEPVIGEAVEVVTMEDLPGGPPKEVTVVPVPSSDTTLEVKWQVCMYVRISGNAYNIMAVYESLHKNYLHLYSLRPSKIGLK